MIAAGPVNVNYDTPAAPTDDWKIQDLEIQGQLTTL